MICDSRFYMVREQVVRRDMELHAVRPPRIIMAADGKIKTALSGTFAVQGEADLLHDHIQAVLLLDDGEHNAGEFVVTTCRTVQKDGETLWELEAYDQGYLVSRSRQEKRLSFPAGTAYMQIIQPLLMECGVTRISADVCKDTLQTDREWAMGTETLEIVNTLLKEMAFRTLWFDADGYARLTRYRKPQAGEADHVYRADALSILQENCSQSWDVFGAKNIFIAAVGSPDYRQLMTARAENNDAGSPISTVNLGRVMAPIIQVDNIASQEALQDYVNKIRDDSMLSTETVTFYTMNQIHGIGDLIAVEHPRMKGIFQELSWEMEMGPGGLMCHTGKRVISL